MSSHVTSRRTLLRGSALGAAGLAVLSLGLPRIAASQAVTPQAGMPWLGGDVPPTSRSSRQMAVAARTFLDTLSTEQLAVVQYSDLGDAARTKWTNFPAAMAPRPGLLLGTMTDEQRVKVHDLLRASTSSQGYLKMTGAIRADQVLAEIENNSSMFGSALYYTTVFGNPEDANWAWMITGHHMSAMFTVAGDRTGFTPMFTGAQPLMIPSGVEAGWHVLPQDASIEEFVGNADFDAADAQLALVQQTWGDMHFAWQGPPPSSDAMYYFRVHGPRVLIEYDVQAPLNRNGGHIHAITRDPANDYGMDWLGLYYQEV